MVRLGLYLGKRKSKSWCIIFITSPGSGKQSTDECGRGGRLAYACRSGSLCEELKRLLRWTGLKNFTYPVVPPLRFVGGPIFPFKAMIGHYDGKFSCVYNVLSLLVQKYFFLAEYMKYGSICLFSVALWGSRPVVWTADPDVFRFVCLQRNRIFAGHSRFECDVNSDQSIKSMGRPRQIAVSRRLRRCDVTKRVKR